MVPLHITGSCPRRRSDVPLPQKMLALKSIGSRIFAHFALLVIAPVCIMGAFAHHSSSLAIRKYLDGVTLGTLGQLGLNVEYRTRQVVSSLGAIASSATLSETVRDASLAGYDSRAYASGIRLDELFASLLPGDVGIRQAIVVSFGDDGYYSYLDPILDPRELMALRAYRETLRLGGVVHWDSYTVEPATMLGRRESYILGGRVVRDHEAGALLEPIGAVFVLLSEKRLAETLQIAKIGTVVVANEQGVVISHPDSHMIGRSLSDYATFEPVATHPRGYYRRRQETEDVVVAYDTTASGFKIIGVIPYSLFAQELRDTTRITIGMAFLCVALLFAVSFLFSRQLAIPIRRLQIAMRRVEGGDFHVSVRSSSIDEVGLMTASFNRMVARMNELTEEAVLREKRKNEMEWLALQYQINPHFINNAVSTIRTTAMLNGDTVVASLLEVLARLLHKTLRKAGMLIKVNEELQNARDYTFLCQAQCRKDAITVEWRVDREVDELFVPSMLLQPVLENSFVHGRCKPDLEVLVTVAGSVADGVLKFTIADNGPGIPPEQLDELFGRHEEALNQEMQGDHVGLRNTNARLKARFGREYGVEVRSDVGEGTIVTITLPVVRSAAG